VNSLPSGLVKIMVITAPACAGETEPKTVNVSPSFTHVSGLLRASWIVMGMIVRLIV